MRNYSAQTEKKLESEENDVMSIGQLAKAAKVSNRTVRYYEELGLIVPLSRGSNRYRYYDDSHIDRLRLIKMLQESGFALKEIVGALNPILDPEGKITYSGYEMANKVSTSLKKHLDVLKNKQEELNNTINAINNTLHELNHCFNCGDSNDLRNCANCEKGPAEVVSLGRRFINSEEENREKNKAN